MAWACCQKRSRLYNRNLKPSQKSTTRPFTLPTPLSSPARLQKLVHLCGESLTHQAPRPQALHHHADVGHALRCGFLERSDKWLVPSRSCYVHISSSCPWGHRVRAPGRRHPHMEAAEDRADASVRATHREAQHWSHRLRVSCALCRPGQHCHLVECRTIAPMCLGWVKAESQTSDPRAAAQ